MADRLNANQLDHYSRRNLRSVVTRTATIDNDAISPTDISPLVKKWGGKIKTGIYGKHPSEREKIRFPVLTLEVDNADAAFDMGGAYFPNGLTDLASTIIDVVITIRAPGEATAQTVLDCTGRIREPEYTEDGSLRLVAEHVLTELSTRKWLREDRIGGDTGINDAFAE